MTTPTFYDLRIRYEGANEYTADTARTDWPDVADRKRDALLHAGLGLASEAGEIAGLLQKWVGQGHSLDEARMMLELGDALWFIAKLCRALGVSMADVMALNTMKLAERYPDGWDPERSINRA